jgi:uracil-DNA glycosylase
MLQAEMRACRRCLQAGHAVTPGAVFTGQASARVMIIGQAPGITEVTARRPFNAGSGRRLFQWLGEAGWEEVDFRACHYMTAVTKCYPGKASNGKGDRVPSRAEQLLCRPFLEAEIASVDPCLIIPVGGLAIGLFYPKGRRLNQTIGTAAYFPPGTLKQPFNFELSQATILDAYDPALPQEGRWIIPLPHPSGASLWPNRPRNRALIRQAIDMLSAVREYWKL